MRAFSWGDSQGRWDYSSAFLSWLCLLAQIDSTSHLKSFLSTGLLSSRRFPSSTDDTVIHIWINKKYIIFSKWECINKELQDWRTQISTRDVDARCRFKSIQTEEQIKSHFSYIFGEVSSFMTASIAENSSQDIIFLSLKPTTKFVSYWDPSKAHNAFNS